MQYGMYSIRDTKTEVFSNPWISHNNNTAMRTFSDAAHDPQTNIYKHPADFQLIKVGDWDDDQGRPIPHEHITLAFASDYRNEQITTQAANE